MVMTIAHRLNEGVPIMISETSLDFVLRNFSIGESGLYVAKTQLIYGNEGQSRERLIVQGEFANINSLLRVGVAPEQLRTDAVALVYIAPKQVEIGRRRMYAPLPQEVSKISQLG